MMENAGSTPLGYNLPNTLLVNTMSRHRGKTDPRQGSGGYTGERIALEFGRYVVQKAHDETRASTIRASMAWAERLRSSAAVRWGYSTSYTPINSTANEPKL